MKLLLKIIFFAFLIISSSTLTAQQTNLNAVILNKADSTPIVNAHILNINKNAAVKSDDKGLFSISANKSDILLISFVGFKSLKIITSTVHGIIYLQKEAFILEPYTVIPYQNFNEFKEAFVKLKIQDTTRNKINQSIFLTKEELKMYDGSSGFGGGISALLGKFNKYVQDKKNYERLLEQDKYEAILDKKFNPQLIKRITTLKDSSIVNGFIAYCDFTNHFIEYSSEYELVDRILECFDEYNNLSIANK